MALRRTNNRRFRTVPLALLLASWADRPRTTDEFDALLLARSVPAADRDVLRRAWVSGGIVFFLADSGRFASRQGAVAPPVLEREFERALGGERGHFRDLARRLMAGETTLDAFRAEAARMIEETYWEAALLLFGPLLYSLPGIMNTVLELIRLQLAYLDRLISDLQSGRQLLDGSFLRRFAMYAGSGWAALQELARQEAFMDGKREERNRLGVAEHCGGCIEETEKGWVPIGTLVPIGSRDCLSNCRCHMEFR